MASLKAFLRNNLAILTLLCLVGCQSTQQSRPPAAKAVPKASKDSPKTAQRATPAAAKPKAATPSKTPETEKVTYNPVYDEEIKTVFDLAKKNKWEDAEAHALALYERDPKDNSAQRLYDWITKQRQLHRNQALEDKIREIDAKSSVFNPSVIDLLKENKDRGLPPRKDLRDAIEKIEATPYVPENFGKTIQQKGTLFDLDSNQGQMAKILEKDITVQLDNVPLETIIFSVAQSAGINFVADKTLPALKQPLGVKLDKVKLGEFLRYVSRNFELQFQVGSDLIWIVDGKDPKKLLEETRFYRLRKGFVMPAEFGASEVTQVKVTTPQNVTTVTETRKIEKFVNDNAPAVPSIEEAIKAFFTENTD